jgi:NAD(P)H-dependent FMN reductase
MTPTRILAITGSTRQASTNTAFCRSAEAHPPPGVEVSCYDELAGLPQFNPDDDHDPLPEPVRRLRQAIAQADAVLFCTPEYAGALPGALKNLLDWTVGGTELTGKPAAWIAVAPDPRRGSGAHQELAVVLGYLQAKVIDSAGGHVPIDRSAVDAEGRVSGPDVIEAISAAVGRLARAADPPRPSR